MEHSKQADYIVIGGPKWVKLWPAMQCGRACGPVGRLNPLLGCGEEDCPVLGGVGRSPRVV